ncbi:glycine--tRNA ligase [Candidatus Woesearchaeota archaeon B3_Woes]|nr:MAG: glycine--tRNA ligase [Candidatus Woesearchaeota archaeon B3_Woes]
MPAKITIEDMTVFCKKKGFVYSSAEIYGGLAGFWDFGPLGVELKNNIKAEWWKFFVQNREDVVGVDGSIITNPKVWEASGHVDSFTDVYVVCEKCKKPNKIDKAEFGKVKCDCGGKYTNQGDFNLMFKTQVGPGKGVTSYLRPETAQLIFTNFKLVAENARMKLPFGIAQIGKAFRNEISPREFLFRSREFEQMELQYFIDPDKVDDCPFYNKIKNQKINILTSKEKVMSIEEMLKNKIFKNKWHAYWLSNSYQWFLSLGIDKNNLRLREHRKDELSHYANAAVDIEYKFSTGWKEIFGSHDRSQFDLTQHEKTSKKELKTYDETTNKKILPLVIESSFGVERAMLAFLFDAYNDDKKRGNIVLNLHNKLAPVKIGVFSLVNKLNKETKQVYDILKEKAACQYDTAGSVGRRYARADEIGIPFCITFDFDSLKDKSVTIRNRNDTKQVRVKIAELKDTLKSLLDSEIKFEKTGKKI